MDATDLKYVVLMLNTEVQQYMSTGERIDTHDGEIFESLEDAHEYATDCVANNLCTRFAIGRFVIDKQKPRTTISMVETFGFRNDKKSINQLDLFKK